MATPVHCFSPPAPTLERRGNALFSLSSEPGAAETDGGRLGEPTWPVEEEPAANGIEAPLWWLALAVLVLLFLLVEGCARFEVPVWDEESRACARALNEDRQGEHVPRALQRRQNRAKQKTPKRDKQCARAQQMMSYPHNTDECRQAKIANERTRKNRRKGH